MPAYEYIAFDSDGKESKGILEGDAPRHIRQLLRDQGLTPVQINSVGNPTKTRQNKLKISSSDLTLITRQLATLLNAGMPVEEALTGVAEQTEKAKIKIVLMGVRAHVLEGHSLASGLSKFPRVFNDIYCATVAAGESSSHLDKVLDRLADFTERQQAIKQKVQHALVYPSLMSLVSIAIVIFLLTSVVPQIVSVFEDNQTSLPLLTSVLLHISSLVQHYGWYILSLVVILLVASKRAIHIEHVRIQVDKLLLHLPLVAYFIKTVNTARFSRTLGTLSHAGVPILEAFNISAALINNHPMSQAIKNAGFRIKEGTSIHRALKRTGFFPAMSIHLIATGEKSGQLDDMLNRAALNQERDVERLIDTTLSLFEPLLILFMGGVVLFIVLAVLLPIFDMPAFLA